MTAHPSSGRSHTLQEGAGGGWSAPVVQHTLARAAVSRPSLLSLVREECPERDRSGPSVFAAYTLGLESRPVRAARHFTESTLRDWDMGNELVDNVAVIASEMVTNALRYGLTDEHGTTPPHQVWIGLLRQGSTVLCAVFDPGTGIPVVKEPDYLAESGRGLHVVESLCDNWGWTSPDHSGKAVWAILSTPGR